MNLATVRYDFPGPTRLRHWILFSLFFCLRASNLNSSNPLPRIPHSSSNRSPSQPCSGRVIGSPVWCVVGWTNHKPGNSLAPFSPPPSSLPGARGTGSSIFSSAAAAAAASAHLSRFFSLPTTKRNLTLTCHSFL